MPFLLQHCLIFAFLCNLKHLSIYYSSPAVKKECSNRYPGVWSESHVWCLRLICIFFMIPQGCLSRRRMFALYSWRRRVDSYRLALLVCVCVYLDNLMSSHFHGWQSPLILQKPPLIHTHLLLLWTHCLKHNRTPEECTTATTTER